MKISIFKFIAAITPKKLLAPAHKAVANCKTHETKRIELSTEEKRELLERNMTHKKEQFLNKYSPIRLLKKAQKKTRLERRKKDFHSLIGQITLAHAGIEQNLKAVLTCDWGLPEEAEFMCGGKLINHFKKEIKKTGLPESKCAQYKRLCAQFKEISRSRNNILKALYGHNSESLEIFQLNQIAHNNMFQIMKENDNNFEDFKKKWMKTVEEEELQSLLNSLNKMAEEFQLLRSKIFCEKTKLHSSFYSKIGDSHPAYASKNPYLYQERLKNKGKV